MSILQTFSGQLAAGKELGWSAPPSPNPAERLDWRGVRKNALQNLEPQGFRGHNLDNKRVSAAVALSACTASALTMICSFSFEVKVGCDKEIIVPDDSLIRQSHPV